MDISLKISPRYVKQDNEGFRPFQRETLRSIIDSGEKIIFVEAPVGSGKSFIIRKLLEFREFERRPLVFTFPTKILMESQIGSLEKEIGKEKIGIWPYSDFVKKGINLFLYSSDSLLHLMRNKKLEQIDSRGKLLEKLLFDLQWYSKKGGIITSPDVLFLLYSREVYERSKEIQNALANAVILFDEFHLYSELKNFPILLEELLSKNVDKVVMLSATPFESESLKEIKNKYKIIRIDFSNSLGTDKDEIFNHHLDFRYYSFKITDISQTAKKLLTLIKILQKPMAYISDSIFRLQHIKRYIQDENLEDIQIIEWSGFEKEKEIPLSDKTVVLGTSAIEVGIDMPFKSLVFESNYWTSAIQRLGRVGRKEAGVAILFTRKDLETFIKDRVIWERTSFENEVLKEAFNNPREDTVFGDCFRGRNFTFLIFDVDIKRYFIYNEALFSMYDIEDDYECEWQLKRQDEKIKILREFNIPRTEWEMILARDKLFPFWGVVKGKLSREYSKRPEVVYDYNRNELSIFAKRYYYFYGK